MIRPIGFTAHRQLQEQEVPAASRQPTAEEILQARGIAQAWEVMSEYMSPVAYPLLRGEKRDAFFIERMRKIRERYFLDI